MTVELSMLLKELESDSFEVRKSSIERLTNLNDNEVINKLIEITKGGIRKTRTERKKFLGLIPYNTRIEEHYTLNDQLAAIEALSRSSSSEAHKFIRALCSSEVMPWGNSPAECYGGSNGWVDEFKRIFPNAHGPLKDKLDDPIATPGRRDSELVDNDIFLPKSEVGKRVKEAYNRIKQKP